MIRIDDRLSLRDDEVRETFVRASGPGGQNVNKVSSAVRLSFDLAASALPEAVKGRAARLAGRRLSAEGVLTIAAQSHRSLERNRQDALERLLALLRAAALPPPPPRLATRTPRGERRRRVDDKVRRGEAKRLRGAPRGGE